MRERSRSSLQTATVSSGGGSLAGSVAWHATSGSVYLPHRPQGQELRRSRASGQDNYVALGKCFNIIEFNSCTCRVC